MMFWESKHDCAKHGHLFEARYDIEPGRLNLGEGEISHAALEMLVNASIKKTYVHDICVYCGRIVLRPEQ